MASENFVRSTILDEAEKQSIQPGPTYALLAAVGATIALTGTVSLSPIILETQYPGKFQVSPELRAEVILGQPWLRQHQVIHDHGADCIFIGSQGRQRVFLGHAPYTYESVSPIEDIKVEHNFPPELSERFLETIRDHASSFHNGGRLKQTLAVVNHEIRLKNPQPFREAPRRYSEEKRQYIDTQVREMLRDGIIEHTTSPFSSAVVITGKKDGDYRFCVDYRRLNEQTVDAPQCLPRIHETLKDLGSAKFFSTLDLKSGYWQIPMARESRQYTAFSTPGGGQYQFRVMPFGLKNAPGTFQNLMRQVLAEQWGSFAIAYLDDIIVYSSEWGEHLQHLSLVFERLEIYGLTISPKKCRFGQTTLPYLGHVIGTNGNAAQTVHIEAIRDFKSPRTRKELRSFLGICNWVKEYVPNSSEVLLPLTDLLSPKRPYKWTTETQEKFEVAKLAFQNPTSLSRPDPRLPFVLQTDASARGMGAVLMQEATDGSRRIVSYASAKFSPAESRYHCNEQECLAIIWAIKRYRPYLEDAPFILRTDSKTLTWLNSRKDTRDKLTRWDVLLRELTLKVEHVPGKNNELPDALSRHPNPYEVSPGEPDLERMLPPTRSAADVKPVEPIPILSALHAPVSPSLFEEIIDAQQEDPAISRDAIRWRELQGKQPFTREDELFLQQNRLTDNGFWRESSTDGIWRLQIPAVLRAKVIWEYHDAPLSGHPGAEETIRSIQRFFSWPGMNREIRRYVLGCHLCICCKPIRGQATRSLRPRPARSAWETIAIDLMGPYPLTTQGNRFILVVTDLFTRWVEAFPLRASDAPRLTKILEEEVFSRYGYPKRVLSDNGPQFTGNIWAAAAQRWDCQLWTTPVYHPQANPTERRNQELKKGLRLRLYQGNQRTWDRYLSELLFGLRRRQNAATGVTPSYLLFGKTILQPGEWRIFQTPEEADQNEERRQREDEARHHQATYQLKYATVPARPRYFPGDWVYIPNHRLSNKAAGYNAKLAQARLGPYQVLDHISGEVYWVLKDDVMQKVHGSVLIPAPARTIPVELAGVQPLPTQLDQEVEWLPRPHSSITSQTSTGGYIPVWSTRTKSSSRRRLRPTSTTMSGHLLFRTSLGKRVLFEKQMLFQPVPKILAPYHVPVLQSSGYQTSTLTFHVMPGGVTTCGYEFRLIIGTPVHTHLEGGSFNNLLE